MKKLIILLILVAPIFGYSQTPEGETQGVQKFTSSSKLFNDWSVSLYLGTALIQTGDLTSINNGVGDWNFGYDVQIGVNKAISHAFGLILLGQYGQTKQEYVGTIGSYKGFSGETEYYAFSVLGDVNFTSLLRRVDNKSPYRWAVHGYAGLGLINYEARSNVFNESLSTATNPIPHSDLIVVTEQNSNLGSFFAQIGAGLKYKISRRLDAELKASYIFTGDEEFDGSGDPVRQVGGQFIYSPADIEEQRHDNAMTFHLGLSYKIGKQQTHLMWHDPLRELYDRNQEVDIPTQVVCAKGDEDQDGVCDDWDKCLDTPLGARIDGSGCALDTDLDGIIDLYDKCVTVPGTKENQGCPDETEVGPLLSKIFKGIEFDLDKDEIRPDARGFLDNAADIIIKYGNGRRFYVEGHTDARASAEYNQALSQRRVDNAVKYLIGRGVPADQLIPIGKGESELLHPECDPASKCSEEKNEENRRVIFKLAN